ncbi:MAG: hypothetical protein JXA78_04975 [Anaerolineales bacterium]|nr:hypothetical protein [Anaerolineales bacterium]
MSKMKRNFWLDVVLFLLLLVNFGSLAGAGGEGELSPGAVDAWSGIHTLSGALLMLGVGLHVALHRQWFSAVLTGRAKGAPKLFANLLTLGLALFSGLAGFAAGWSPGPAAEVHRLTGLLAGLSMLVHAVMHWRWMFACSKRYLGGGGRRGAGLETRQAATEGG